MCSVRLCNRRYWLFRIHFSFHLLCSSAGNVEPDVIVYSNESPEGKVYEHPDYKEHHGLLIADFAKTVLRGPDAMQGVSAGDSLGESLTAMAIYRANSSGVQSHAPWQPTTQRNASTSADLNARLFDIA